MKNELVAKAMTIKLDNTLPEYPKMEEGYRRAPDRGFRLTPAQAELALRNALRYVPEELHETLAPEFMEELKTRGRIYAYRYRPEGRIYGKPIDEYKGKCIEGKAFQVMIDNNLDFEIALYPYELVTYGETGQPCQNQQKRPGITFLLGLLSKNILKSLPKTRLSLLSPVILSACFLQSPPRPALSSQTH